MRLAQNILLFSLTATLPLAGLGGEGKDALPLVFEENFEKGADRWQPTDAKAWKIVKEESGQVYNQFRMSKYKPPHRSPLNMSLVKDLVVTDFVLEAKVKSTGKDVAHRDMCLFFGHQGPDQFYYVHMARDMDDRANQIFIVNKADRTKISKTTTNGTKWTDGWHHVKVVRKTTDGTIEIYFDDMKTPVMTARDSTFAWGRVGLGSFDDSGKWDDVRVRGNIKK